MMLRINAFSTTILTLSLSAVYTAAAVDLVGEKTVVMFDKERLAVSGTMDVSGFDILPGIDSRPSKNTLEWSRWSCQRKPA